MYKTNLSHSYIKNQQSSWIDDPWGLKGDVTGVTKLNVCHSILSYADELVSQYARFDGTQYNLSLKDLSEDEQNELARLYMDSTDRDVSECVHGNDFSIDNDYTCALLLMLKDNTNENRERFADITRRNIIIYYAVTLQSILDDACHKMLTNMYHEAGYQAYQDQECGDVVWGKC